MAYFDIDVLSKPVSTQSPDAQLWFDRGLVWCYAYAHEEAVECFRKAAAHDPDCAMAYWGEAYAIGPNYNMPWDLFDPDSKATALQTAHSAVETALKKCAHASPWEQDLIAALAHRYPQPAPIDDQSSWDDAFADAMRGVFNRHRSDLDIRAIFVEAMMNRNPWKLWDLTTGLPTEGSDAIEIRSVLEETLENEAAANRHPGILHLYVHCMEMSPTPELALGPAEALRELVPDAGHLIHMPTHIDVQCGRYLETLRWNEKAIMADRKYAARSGPLNLYTAYRLHNLHFAIYGAMFLGQYGPAIRYAEEMIASIPQELLEISSPPMADYMESFVAMKLHVLIRFGKWGEILDIEMPEDRILYCNLTATLHYAKGVAHAALGDVGGAETERKAFRKAFEKVPDSRLLHNNRCRDLLTIAAAMLDGEIEYRKANYEDAFASLRHAVQLDDSLPYDEPWGWMQPVRHALGALLLEQDRIGEAEIVYREDLGLTGQMKRSMIHPDNIWALRGLYECLTKRNVQSEAEGRLIRQRLDFAEALADHEVHASCFCAVSASKSAASAR